MFQRCLFFLACALMALLPGCSFEGYRMDDQSLDFEVRDVSDDGVLTGVMRNSTNVRIQFIQNHVFMETDGPDVLVKSGGTPGLGPGEEVEFRLEHPGFTAAERERRGAWNFMFEVQELIVGGGKGDANVTGFARNQEGRLTCQIAGLKLKTSVPERLADVDRIRMHSAADRIRPDSSRKEKLDQLGNNRLKFKGTVYDLAVIDGRVTHWKYLSSLVEECS